MMSAAMVSSARMCSRMAQPITLRVNRSKDHGQVEPALAGRNVGDIRQPDLMGPVRDKILLEQVCRHWQAMLAVGCAHAIAARSPRPDTCWRMTRSTRLRLTV